MPMSALSTLCLSASSIGFPDSNGRVYPLDADVAGLGRLERKAACREIAKLEPSFSIGEGRLGRHLRAGDAHLRAPDRPAAIGRQHAAADAPRARLELALPAHHPGKLNRTAGITADLDALFDRCLRHGHVRSHGHRHSCRHRQSDYRLTHNTSTATKVFASSHGQHGEHGSWRPPKTRTSRIATSRQPRTASSQPPRHANYRATELPNYRPERPSPEPRERILT